MATSGGEPSAPVGPVPFADVDGEQLVPERRAQPEAGLGDDLADDMVSSLPSKMEVSLPMRLRLYRGFWLAEIHIATMARRASPPASPDHPLRRLNPHDCVPRAHPPDAGAGAGHPLRRLNPHQCVPFLEGLFARGQQAKLDALPSPRLMNTHMPLAMLPSAGGGGGGCRVVYICREPKDMAVSMCHYTRRVMPRVSFAETFESYCDGAKIYGPFWDHILGYWRASSATPDTVLFLRYEELLRDPAGNVRKLAQFVGLPFSEAEEEAGMVGAIVALCSLDNMRGFEANRTGYVDAQRRIPRETLFRKGVAGDWVHHMTPEMARRLDDIVADKFGGTGLAFK
uniref:Sulfotransferase n=1 Tax=Oryza brachyantha TaxID=4533 RepID=J3MCZ4_ORYBR